MTGERVPDWQNPKWTRKEKEHVMGGMEVNVETLFYGISSESYTPILNICQILSHLNTHSLRFHGE